MQIKVVQKNRAFNRVAQADTSQSEGVSSTIAPSALKSAIGLDGVTPWAIKESSQSSTSFFKSQGKMYLIKETHSANQNSGTPQVIAATRISRITSQRNLTQRVDSLLKADPENRFFVSGWPGQGVYEKVQVKS